MRSPSLLSLVYWYGARRGLSKWLWNRLADDGRHYWSHR